MILPKPNAQNMLAEFTRTSKLALYVEVQLLNQKIHQVCEVTHLPIDVLSQCHG